ncbi:MAG: FecR domain-containing protein [Thermodesulfobacteriota bacterium]
MIQKGGCGNRPVAAHFGPVPLGRPWFWLACLLAGMALLAAARVEAATMSAVVVELTGSADLVFKDGRHQALKKGDKLEAAQAIETKAGAKVVLQLEDGSKVEVFEATKISVNELLPEEESKFSLSLFFGRVMARLKKLRSDDVVITPTMVAGVRGTDFAVSVAEDGASVVSVENGQVDVSTDKAWDQTSMVQVEAGQEVQADKAGVELKPRPITLQTMESWQAFRKKRLDDLKTRLPEIIAHLEKGIDPNLEILDKIKALPQDRAEVLKKLDERLASLKPGDVAEKAKLIIQTHMESSNVFSLLKKFRVQRMRVQTTFEQSERLKSLLPSFEKELGPRYKSVDEGLKKILGRKGEVKAKEQAISQAFAEAVKPAQPYLLKYKGPHPNN